MPTKRDIADAKLDEFVAKYNIDTSDVTQFKANGGTWGELEAIIATIKRVSAKLTYAKSRMKSRIAS